MPNYYGLKGIFQEETQIKKERLCRICKKHITEEPGVSFNAYMFHRSASIFFHKECLRRAVNPILGES